MRYGVHLVDEIEEAAMNNFVNNDMLLSTWEGENSLLSSFAKVRDIRYTLEEIANN